MVAKKLVVDGLRINYSGMFSVNDFFKEVDEWTNENGFERDTKKKLEHVESSGKNMEYVFELWKSVRDYARVTIKLRALFHNITDFDLVRGKHKRNLQKGRVLIYIDGWTIQDIEQRWTEKPWYVFWRTLYDKLVWRTQLGRFDGITVKPCNSLFQRLHSYFKRYKY